MYKSKYPTLIDFLTNQEDLILLDSEIQNIENLIDKDLKAINHTHCCKSDSEQLVCDCPICGKEMTSQMVKHHHCKKCNEHYTTT